MRSVLPAATILASVIWLACALALAPTRGPRLPRRAAAAAPSLVDRPGDVAAQDPGVAPSVEIVEEAQAPAVVEREASPSPPAAAAAQPGPADVEAAVAELERVLGGPDFASTMESVRRSLVPLLASDPRAVADALARVLDLRAAGEIRAVLVEALSSGPASARAAEARPVLLMDPSPLVRDAAWRLLAEAR